MGKTPFEFDILVSETGAGFIVIAFVLAIGIGYCLGRFHEGMIQIRALRRKIERDDAEARG